MARALRAWAINRWKKNSVRNLQYGPKTPLIRGIYFSISPKKVLFFRATYDQLSLQKATFEQILERLQETSWEISSNLWKALNMVHFLKFTHSIKD